MKPVKVQIDNLYLKVSNSFDEDAEIDSKDFEKLYQDVKLIVSIFDQKLHEKQIQVKDEKIKNLEEKIA